jgi:hypothetical protein
MTNEIKSNIIRDLQGIDQAVNSHVLAMAGENHTIRMFSCWIDGSYLGEDHYRQNLKRIGECEGNRKKLRSFVIEQFTKYIAHDAQCSYGYAQKVLVGHLGLDTLDKLNDRLINWSINFHAEHVGEVA